MALGEAASVSSNEEREHLFKMAGELEMFIGAYKGKWLDNAYWDFMKYFPPSAKEKEEGMDCIVVNGSSNSWKNAKCTENYPLMCQTMSVFWDYLALY